MPASAEHQANPVRIVLGSSLPRPDEHMARLVTTGRGSLAFILGDDASRFRLLAGGINWDRILLALEEDTPLGYAAFKHQRRGPFSPSCEAFTREFGAWRGRVRYGLFLLSERREWRYEFFLYGLRVARSVRRQGIAKRLLDALFDYGRQQGFKAVELEVPTENLRARALYRATGFEGRGGHSPGVLGHIVPMPEVHVMHRALEPGP